jgi:hypothetical protein
MAATSPTTKRTAPAKAIPTRSCRGASHHRRIDVEPDQAEPGMPPGQPDGKPTRARPDLEHLGGGPGLEERRGIGRRLSVGDDHKGEPGDHRDRGD